MVGGSELGEGGTNQIMGESGWGRGRGLGGGAIAATLQADHPLIHFNLRNQYETKHYGIPLFLLEFLLEQAHV